MKKAAPDQTLYLPLSANPLGYHHLAAAELALRFGGCRQVVLVVSNGMHPDPTKPPLAVSQADRLALAQAGLAALGHPENCFLTRLSQQPPHQPDGPLRIGPQTLAISTLEFAFPRPVRTVELLGVLQQDPATRPPKGQRVRLLAGGDLVARMIDPAIFTDADLAGLATQADYLLLARPLLSADPNAGQDDLPALLERLWRARGVRLTHTLLDAQAGPSWLIPFLGLSSTRIRQAARAGEPLAGMMPAPAAEIIMKKRLYAKPAPAATVPNDSPGLSPTLRMPAPPTPQMPAVHVLQMPAPQILRLPGPDVCDPSELTDLAHQVVALLAQRRQAHLPHTLVWVETSAGGHLAQALYGINGASAYFPQSWVAYSPQAQQALMTLASTPPTPNPPDSAQSGGGPGLSGSSSQGEPGWGIGGGVGGVSGEASGAVSAAQALTLARGALVQAMRIREQDHPSLTRTRWEGEKDPNPADSIWALAESGMAGPPDGTRHSLKNGLCWLALVGKGTPDRTWSVQLDPFAPRGVHQAGFARAALEGLLEALAQR